MKAYRFSKEELYFMKKLESFGSTYSFDRWPEVYWGNTPKNNSDELNVIDDNKYNLDYLGMYFYSKNSEGHIELFKERIEDCANRISIHLELQFDDVNQSNFEIF